MKSYFISIALSLGSALLAQTASAQVATLTPAEERGIMRACMAGVEPIAVMSDTGQYTGEMVMPVFDTNGEPVTAIPVSGRVLSWLKGCDGLDAQDIKVRLENDNDIDMLFAATLRETTAAQ